MKNLVDYINEQLAINEGGLESDKFLLATAEDNSKAAKELEEDWADAILTSTDPHIFLYALPKDTAEAMKETHGDDMTLYVIPVREYPYLNNFEDAYQDGDVTVDDLDVYNI